MKFFLGIGVALLAMTESALAQSNAPEDRFAITGSVRLQYDSNVLRGNDALATDGRSADDFHLTPRLMIDAVKSLGLHSAFVMGSAGYDFYAKNDQLNRENLSGRGGFNVDLFSICNATIAGDYGRRQSDLADLIEINRTVNVQEDRGFDLMVGCNKFIGLSPSLSYRVEEVNNSSLARQISNIRSKTYSGSIGYSRPSFGTLSLYATYRDGSYPNRFFAVGPSIFTDGIEVYSAGLTFERKIGARLQGTISAGITRVDPKLPSVNDFRGLSYSADLLWRNDRASITIGVSRSAEQSNLLAISYSIDTTYKVDGQYALSERIRLLFGAYYSRRRFETSSVIPGATVRPNDKTYYAYGGVSYDLRDNLSFDLDVTHERRNAEATLFDYSSTRVGLTARLTI